MKTLTALLTLSLIIACAGPSVSKKDGPARKSRTNFFTPNGLTHEKIQKIFTQHQGDLRQCFAIAQRENPAAAKGSLTLFYQISKTGRVLRASVNKATIKSKPLARCILSRLLSWEFPAAASESEVDNHTLYFSQ